MKKSNLEDFVTNLSPQLYSYSFSLIPDELQAEQLILDSVALVTQESKDGLDRMLHTPDKNVLDADEFWRPIKLKLLKEIYRLARKRSPHLKTELVSQEQNPAVEYSDYYHLNLQTRSVLFLKSRMKMTIEDIMEVMELNRFDIFASLNVGRDALLSSAGIEYDWELGS